MSIRVPRLSAESGQRFSGASAFGVDLAIFQGQAPPYQDLIDRGGRFFYTKATHGEVLLDGTFIKHWTDLGAIIASSPVRVRRGPYMWLEPTNAVAQVESLARALDRVGWDPSKDWQPAIDFEDRRFSLASAIVQIETAVSRGISLFGKVEIYTGRWFWADNVGDVDSELCASCALWFAQYPKIWKGQPTDYVNAIRALPPHGALPFPWAKRSLEPVLWQFDGNGGLRLPNGVDCDFDLLRDDCDLETLLVQRCPTTMPAPPNAYGDTLTEDVDDVIAQMTDDETEPTT